MIDTALVDPDDDRFARGFGFGAAVSDRPDDQRGAWVLRRDERPEPWSLPPDTLPPGPPPRRPARRAGRVPATARPFVACAPCDAPCRYLAVGRALARAPRLENTWLGLEEARAKDEATYRTGLREALRAAAPDAGSAYCALVSLAAASGAPEVAGGGGETGWADLHRLISE